MNQFKDLRIQPNLSSVPLQILLRYNTVYTTVYFICHATMHAYKGIELRFPRNHYISEIILLLFFMSIESARLLLMHRSNLLESEFEMAMSILLFFPNVVFCVWVVLWQTYTFYIELILTVGLLMFYLSEMIIGILLFITFARNSRSTSLNK
ncbi:transmembrane protein 216 [Paragonimus westermani]|uniref:Transmembrane protein 216 n=1 Tax=Paragonimus westermani TaxID=34504 RepID=A0A5J4N8N3_9TREM|nr:transmembrane protein 216 [Paragonimus westermani]